MGRLYPGSYQVTARPVSAREVLPATATDPVEDPRSVSGWVSPGPGGLPRTSSLLGDYAEVGGAAGAVRAAADAFGRLGVAGDGTGGLSDRLGQRDQVVAARWRRLVL